MGKVVKKQKKQRNENARPKKFSQKVEKKEHFQKDKVGKDKPKQKSFKKKKSGDENVNKNVTTVKEVEDKKKMKEEREVKEVEQQQEDEGKEEEVGEQNNQGEEEKKDQNSGRARRYIVFVGNLPFEITAADLENHFAKAGKVLSCRVRNEKGFAFVEFKNAYEIEKAIKYHHTMLKGRKINVELTAGGGGNNSERKQKIKEKNHKVTGWRKKTISKLIGSKPKSGSGNNNVEA